MNEHTVRRLADSVLPAPDRKAFQDRLDSARGNEHKLKDLHSELLARKGRGIPQTK